MPTNSQVILITGAGGYLGRSVAVALAGNDLIRLDIFKHPSVDMSLDFAEITPRALAGVDTVIHLAGISSDSAADANPSACERINNGDTLIFAEKAKRAGVRRFIFASSASLYARAIGQAREFAESEALPAPERPYAHSKWAAEAGLSHLADGSFQVVCLRQGTIYGFGYGPIRFDLAVHKMLMHALFDGVLTVNDGRQLRPLLHIRHASEAYKRMVQSPLPNPFEILNIADANWSMEALGSLIQAQFVAADFPVELVFAPKLDVSYTCDTSKERALFPSLHIPVSNGIAAMVLTLQKRLARSKVKA